MDVSGPPSRRRLLGCFGAVALGALAGCVGGDDSDANDGDSSEEGDTGADTGATGGDESDSDSDGADDGGQEARDLREANVVGVEFERQGGAYQFDVTLHHDDDGEDGYANWWQVERLDGRTLGRRELLHAHAQQPFTRSGTVEIPDGVDCVVVRGHDQTHGYGGLAAIITLETGEVRTLDQGTEQGAFDTGDCPE